jgi:hypothetical protein
MAESPVNLMINIGKLDYVTKLQEKNLILKQQLEQLINQLNQSKE